MDIVVFVTVLGVVLGIALLAVLPSHIQANARAKASGANVEKPDMASVNNTDTGFLTNLWQGNFGLPMSYWVYGILGGFVWAVGIVALSPEKESGLERLIYFLMVAYYLLVYVGIWRAANKFMGAKVWAILAKFVVVIVALPVAIRLVKWIFQ